MEWIISLLKYTIGIVLAILVGTFIIYYISKIVSYGATMGVLQAKNFYHKIIEKENKKDG